MLLSRRWFQSLPIFAAMEAKLLRKAVESLMWVVFSASGRVPKHIFINSSDPLLFCSAHEQWWIHWSETPRKVLWSKGRGDIYCAGWPGNVMAHERDGWNLKDSSSSQEKFETLSTAPACSNSLLVLSIFCFLPVGYFDWDVWIFTGSLWPHC